MKRALWVLEAACIIILAIPLAIMPTTVSLKTGKMLGIVLFYLWGSRRKIALNNLKEAVSSGGLEITETPDRIIQTLFQNLGKGFAEVIKIYFGLGRNIIESVTFEGIEHFQTARSKGKGVLFITGHCGNWELLAIASARKLSPVSVVARAMNNPYLNRVIEKARRTHGNRIIYKKAALKNILRALRSNEAIGILMDQAVLAREGFVIDFLGRGAWTTKMPALIARKTGAAVLPAFIHRTEHGHIIRIFPEVQLSHEDDKEEQLKKDTKKFSSYAEEYIQQYPSEWLWIHRRWKRVKGPKNRSTGSHL